MTLGGIDLIALTATLMVSSTPVLLAALGELVVEKSGVLNLGVEGMMIMGAIGGFAAAVMTGSPAVGFAAGALAGMGMALLFGVITQILLANQVATGLALTLFGLGLSALFGKGFEGIRPPQTARIDFGGLADLPVLGPILFSHDWVVYFSLFAVGAVGLFLSRSRAGLILRAVGENHDAAHALGYRVVAVRLAALAFGGAMAGLGGAYLSLVRVPQWTEGMTAGAGWIALAIVVFAGWRAGGVLLGAYLFGGVTALQLRLQAAEYAIPVQLLSMAPYLITIIVLVAISALHARGRQAAPAALGRSFHASR
ncbi:ABC transporter permease [Phaeovulum vinaykumarii]|uniref:Nucleoside ABC transporter membrane protein n=1 Tax=Phaeovulum vinaykumarii TaxID=407234 RepID=A0A1N7LGE7_9RHOB|nr:ABC transporter permease [Phaeovulum vinaykumarii]SIS72841.1 nucleoside ABC transporter membrane protein [Phaeovulum vinaykumarii]SOC04532.1 nucleoside ABC transporter membrane protein [Phaeovulum vinaykumarii]